MGLLDDVMDAALRGGGNDSNRPGGGLGDLLGGLLGSGQQQRGDQAHDPAAGGDGGLAGMLGGLLGGSAGAGQDRPGGGGLADLFGSLLGNDGQAGGLGGLLHKFDQAGLGSQARSWVGHGPNAQVSGEQVDQALGHDTLGNLASRFGINASTLAPLIASVLPSLIDRLTPHGKVPDQGLGDQHEVQRRLTDSP